MTIRERLKALKKTQVWLLLELRKYGMNVRTSELSYILSGVNTEPKARRVLVLCDSILKDEEAKNA